MTDSIDDLLSRARLAYEPCTRTEIAAARDRLIARLTRTPDAGPAPDEAGEESTSPSEARTTPSEYEAARDLRTLCETVVARTTLDSIGELFLPQTLMFQPVGARVLGCLLELARSEEAARFWWQYAAGAGDVPAAFCLYLHHLTLGEVGEAGWWYTQSTTTQSRPPAPLGECLCCTPSPYTFTSALTCVTGVNSVTSAEVAAALSADHEVAPDAEEEAIEETGDAFRDGDASLPTTLRILSALKGSRSGTAPVSVSLCAVLDYVPVALGYVDDDLDLPLPAPDFADHLRSLTAHEPPPASAGRSRGSVLPARTAHTRSCFRTAHTRDCSRARRPAPRS